jgi:hypothetical protein
VKRSPTRRKTKATTEGFSQLMGWPRLLFAVFSQHLIPRDPHARGDH